VRVPIKNIFETRAIGGQVMQVGQPDDISESEFISSNELGGLELSLEDVEELVESFFESGGLGSISSLSIESGTKEELNNDVGDRGGVGLVDREPLLDKSTFLQIGGIKSIVLAILSDILGDGTRFKDTEVSIIKDGDLTEGLMLVQVIRGFVFSSTKVDGLELIWCTNLLQYCSNSTSTSGASVAEKLIGRHDGVEREREGKKRTNFFVVCFCWCRPLSDCKRRTSG
jgi:hypothetical protein